MRRFSWLFKTAAVVLSIAFVMVSLSFVKAWLNSRNSDLKVASAIDVTGVSDRVTLVTTPTIGESLPTVVSTPIPEPAELGQIVEMEPLPTVDDVRESMNESEPSTEPPVVYGDGKEVYSSFMREFIKKSLEPLGYHLHSDEYFQNEINGILLYFAGNEEMNYDVKRLAAIALGKFVYGEFEKNTGFDPDYLKVHLKLPEGNSFALSREDYAAWAASGTGDDELYNKYTAKEAGTEVVPEVSTELPVFDAPMLQEFLVKALGDGYGFKVEGNSAVDPGIYVHIAKSGKEIEPAQLEDLIINLCRYIFRDYQKETNQRIGAFKLIDNTSNTLTVFYREDVNTLWPEGGSDELLREYIRNGQHGPLS